jgi:serine/threonine-protein kinase
MSQLNWHRVEEVYAAALEKAPAERQAFLDAACAQDPPELRARVEALLRDDEAKSEGPGPEAGLEDLLGRLARSLLGELFLRPGTRLLDRYTIGSVLGVGGMGVVYRATDDKFHPPKPVAVKMIAAEIALAAESEARARFVVEMNTGARMTDDRFVKIFYADEWNQQPFIVMELVEPGKSLAEREPKKMAPREAAQLVEELAEAMTQPHGFNIIHRDLKPDNVLMTAGGRPKITDFGIAKLAGEAEALALPQDLVTGRSWAATETGRVIGTPDYMAPEQWRGDQSGIDARTDIYALGAILYELLTGLPPSFAEIHQELKAKPPVSDSEYRMRYKDRLHRLMRELRPGVPWELQTICWRCLELEPADRYATAQALAEDLGRFRRYEPFPESSLMHRHLLWMRRRPIAAALRYFLAAVALVSPPLIILFYNQAEASKLAEGHARQSEQRALQFAGERDRYANEKEQETQRANQEKKNAEAQAAGLAFHQGVNLCEQGQTGSGIRLLGRALVVGDILESYPVTEECPRTHCLMR